jgi:hypothetical protein
MATLLADPVVGVDLNHRAVARSAQTVRLSPSVMDILAEMVGFHTGVDAALAARAPGGVGEDGETHIG